MDESAMSPVAESATKSAKSDARREMLMKWKKDKELKKKMDEQGNKKPFRVGHIDAEAFRFPQVTQPSKAEATTVKRSVSVSKKPPAVPSHASVVTQPASKGRLRSATQSVAVDFKPVSARRQQKSQVVSTDRTGTSTLQSHSRPVRRLHSDTGEFQRVTRSQSKQKAQTRSGQGIAHSTAKPVAEASTGLQSKVRDDREAVMDSAENVSPCKSAPVSSSATDVPMDGAEIVQAAVDEDKHLAPLPKSLTRSRTRSMVSPGITFASVRKTPKNLRNSLLLSRMSPEEGVELLRNSPMVEMKRRKSIRHQPDSIDTAVAAMPSFNDVEKILDASGLVDDVFDNTTASVSESKTDDGDKAVPSSKVDVTYFRNLIQSETNRLKVMCAVWRSNIEDSVDLSDEVRGCIRTTIGQAELLMAERFKQFAGLVDNCEFGTGQKKVTCSDLQGFWDMVYFQVEDHNQKFSDLDKMKAADWVIAKQSPEETKPHQKEESCCQVCHGSDILSTTPCDVLV